MAASSSVGAEPGMRRTPYVGCRRPLNIGHRGSSGLCPEHTFASYDLALQQGVDYLELDLQMTRDGALVAVHDPTLDRTARGIVEDSRGPIGTKTLEQVKRCDVGSWFNEMHPQRAQQRFVGLGIPTLEEVFQRYGPRASYYIEAKHPVLYPGLEEELLRIIEACGLTGPAHERRAVLIQSFDAASLRKIHALDPDMPLVKLFHRSGDVSISRSLPWVAEYAVAIGPRYLDATERLVCHSHELGLEVHPYTVNSTRNMKRLIDRRVDGIFTDFPCRLEHALDASATASSPRFARFSPPVHPSFSSLS